MKARRTGLTVLPAWLYLAFAAAGVAALLVRLPGGAAELAGADALYLPMLFADLARGGALGDWALTPGPYVFPDMPLFAVAWALAGAAGDGWRGALLVNAVLQVAALALAAAGIGRTAGLSWGRAALLAPAALALPPLAAAALATGSAFAVFGVPILPGFHAGAAIIALAVTALLLAGPGWSPARRRWGLALLSLATILSDSFFLLFFTAPAAVLLLRDAVADVEGRDGHLRDLAAVVGAGLVALAIQDAVNPLGGAYRESLALGWDAGFWRLGQILAVPGHAAALAVAMLCWLPAAVAGARALLRRGRLAPLDRFAAIILVGGVTVLVLPVALGIIREIDAARYLLPVSLFGPVWLALRLAGALPRRLELMAGGATVATAAILIATAAPRLPDPPALACLPDGVVLTDYWNAKPLRLFSDGRVQAVPVAADGAPYWWIASRGWWRDAAPVAILMDRLDAAAIEGTYGPFARRETCGGADLWYPVDPVAAGAALAAQPERRLPRRRRRRDSGWRDEDRAWA